AAAALIPAQLTLVSFVRMVDPSGAPEFRHGTFPWKKHPRSSAASAEPRVPWIHSPPHEGEDHGEPNAGEDLHDPRSERSHSGAKAYSAGPAAHPARCREVGRPSRSTGPHLQPVGVRGESGLEGVPRREAAVPPEDHG